MPNSVAMVMTSKVGGVDSLFMNLPFHFRRALLTYGAGRGSMLRYHPLRYPELYNTFDLGFKEACCGVANMASYYYSRRPTDDCSAYQQPALSK